MTSTCVIKRRAGQSIVLNIAEDQGRAGRSRTYHFRIALGSAAELCAALNLVARDTTEEQNKLRRVGMMLRIIGAVGEAHRSAG